MKKPHFLILSEKPSLSRTVQDVYKVHKDKYSFTADFMSFAGHLCELKQPEEYNEDWKKWDLNNLPMIPESFLYNVTKSKYKLFSDIKKAVQSGDYDAIVNNCDGDAEGQAIFHTNINLMKTKLPLYRLWANDLTENEIDRAFSNLRNENEESLKNLTNRAFSRARMDWLIGMNGTRTFALKTNSKTVIGRVQTPVLKLIVDRENEILNFVPKEYFNLEAEFNSNGNVYTGLFFTQDGTTIDTKIDADKIKNNLIKDSKIIAVETKRVESYAPSLFSLTTLQQEANIKLGYSAQKTLDLAQALYEKKVTSYPRTDSTYVTENVAKTFSNLLKSLQNIAEYNIFIKKITKVNLDKASKNSKYVNDKKVGSHYALIPTTQDINKVSLTTDEKKLYDLIVRRFIAIFMPASICDKTVIITQSNNYNFKTNGSIMVESGYLEILGKNSNDIYLPKVNVNDSATLLSSNILSKFTQPPVRYNDATLIKAMETAGKTLKDEKLLEEMKGLSLGTPATRAGIIERLLKIGVINKDKKYFFPSELGLWQIKTLGDMNIANAELTAEFEKKLNMIEDGTKKVDDFNKEMIDYINNLVSELKTLNSLKIASNNNSKTNGTNTSNTIIGKCPKCGKEVISTTGKFGNYFKCIACDFKISGKIAKKNITESVAKELLKNKVTKEIKGFTSSKGNKFNAILTLENNEVKFKFN